MNKPLTLGSLFDGSGTFPVAGILSGILPVWKSEIEPFPIAVTEKRLPCDTYKISRLKSRLITMQLFYEFCQCFFYGRIQCHVMGSSINSKRTM